MLFHASLSNDEIARKCGYVYAVLIVEEKQVYIGQTCATQGALGRLSQHLTFGPVGTLRKRVHEVLRAELTNLGAVEFAAVRLSDKNIFHDEARDYREAVEGLCQYRMIQRVENANFNVGFISRVVMNGYTRVPEVAAEAERVSGELFLWLEVAIANLK
ncbi:MAG: hypothetical protein OXE04_05120 [bacterium]|nr:hypothetical protein [bacterium]